MKKTLHILLALLILTSAAGVATAQPSSKKKCPTCGKPYSECPYKFEHPATPKKRTSKSNRGSTNQSTTTRSAGMTQAQRDHVLRDLEANMVRVEGGTFMMGATSEQGSDAFSNEKPSHQVTLSGFYICKYEVTQELWQAVMGTTVRQQRDKANPSWNLFGEGANYPMYYISWEECQTFIGKLNRLTGKQYRLPTEAEWEYAARGGNKSRGYKYAGSNTLGDVAWYESNSGSTTHPVGQKSPNDLGLYDMSGNVGEWCQDWFGDYGSGSQTNPMGPSTGSNRVSPGGSWGSIAGFCRVSIRDCYEPVCRLSFLGLRLAASSL